MKTDSSRISGSLGFTLLFLALSFCVSGCATFPGKNLPAYTFADLPPAPAQKVCLVISENCSKECKEGMSPIIETLEKSGYFAKAPEHCSSSGNKVENSMNMTFDNDFRLDNFAITVVSSFICGATFTIVPAYGRDDYVMKVQVKRNEQLVKEYVYRENLEMWIHLSMLFMMADHTAGATIRELFDRMVMNFLYDYAHDVHQGRLALGD